MTNVDSPPNDPKKATETIKRLCNRFLPANDRYRRIAVALIVCFTIAFLPLYFIAQSNETIFKIVYWSWRSTIFGVWADTSPYECYRMGGDSVICNGNMAGTPHLMYGLAYLIGGAISLRLSVLCLEYIEVALGVDLISRALNKILPGEVKPSK